METTEHACIRKVLCPDGIPVRRTAKTGPELVTKTQLVATSQLPHALSSSSVPAGARRWSHPAAVLILLAHSVRRKARTRE
jgi:hypothetical protein